MKHNGRRPKLTREEKAKRTEKRERTGRNDKLFDKRYAGLRRALDGKGKEIK